MYRSLADTALQTSISKLPLVAKVRRPLNTIVESPFTLTLSF